MCQWLPCQWPHPLEPQSFQYRCWPCS
jgi:hypothetical protein